MTDPEPQKPDSLAIAVDSLLRSTPEQWTAIEHDALTAAEQRVIFLLVAAGLVERRFALRLEMAGQPGAVEATLAATGERGLAESIEPMLAEMWTRWGGAFQAWKAGDAASASPFRVAQSGPDEWRLTEFGVMARADLDVESPSDGAAAFVGCRQRTLEFVLRTGNQHYRPGVDGKGRLVRMETVRDGASTDQPAAATPAQPTQVALSNTGEIAIAFRDALLPGIQEALQSRSPSKSKAPGKGMPIAKVIREAEKHVRAHDGVYPGRNKLAEIIGCSPASITKAVERSVYLKTRVAEHKAARSGKPREVQLSGSMDEFTDGVHAEPESPDAELERLIAEQQAEQRREERQRKAASKRPRRDD